MAELQRMIQLSPTMEEGHLVEWLKQEGDSIDVGELIAEVETDKASMEMESYFDGVVLKLLVEADTAVPVGAPIAIIGEKDEDISDLLAELGRHEHDGAKAPAPSVEEEVRVIQDKHPTPAPSAAQGRVLSSPLARNLAQSHNLAIETLSGSGPAGRIIKRDVEAALAQGSSAELAPPPAAPRAATVQMAPATPRVEQSLSLSPMRKAIAKNTTLAWQAPVFMLTRTIVMDEALRFRASMNAQLLAQGRNEKISLNDLVIKAVSKALVDVPACHVSFQGDAIVQYARSRIGVAVALEDGLITPVIEEAESKGLLQITRETSDLAQRARSKKLSSEEYSGASFSISNLGMLGVDHFTAILNPPGACILAVGRGKAILVPADNAQGFRSETQMSVTLTCDHRALDGATGARWLQAFATYLEHPATLLL